MSMEYSAVYSPRFELDVGGTTYQESDGRIGDLVVETTVDGADLCSFTFTHPFDPEHGEFAGVDWSTIEPGTDIEVSVGWGGAGTIEPVFVGTGQSITLEATPAQGPRISVSGYGLLHEMMRSDVERSWSDATVAAVAEEVLGAYFPNVDVDGPGIERNRIIQHGENDYRVLRRLAEEYGFQFYADRDTANFTPRSSIGTGDAVATLSYGGRLSTFTGELNEASRISEVEVRYYDMSAEKEVVGSASDDGGTGKAVFRVACDSKEEADRIAEARLSALSMSLVTGHGEAEGVPALTAGSIVRIEDLGERFGGKYYVDRATHRIGTSGYRTSFDVKEIPE